MPCLSYILYLKYFMPMLILEWTTNVTHLLALKQNTPPCVRSPWSTPTMSIPVSPPAVLSVSLMSHAASSSFQLMAVPAWMEPTWMTVANVCLLLAVLVTTKERLYPLEKLFMIMVLSGKRFVKKKKSEEMGYRKSWNYINVMKSNQNNFYNKYFQLKNHSFLNS